jgi:hypothetical protein
VAVVVVVVVAATPNYLRQASQNLGKYLRLWRDIHIEFERAGRKHLKKGNNTTIHVRAACKLWMVDRSLRPEIRTFDKNSESGLNAQNAHAV